MANDIIGVVTSVEDDGYGQQTWKMVTLGTGEILKVKSGRDGVLKAKWGLLQEGVAIKFTMQDYMKEGVAYPYVQDIETVEGELPASVRAETVPVPETPVKGISAEMKKDRAVALSYSKDVWIAGKIEKNEVIETANWFLRYVHGEV